MCNILIPIEELSCSLYFISSWSESLEIKVSNSYCNYCQTNSETSATNLLTELIQYFSMDEWCICYVYIYFQLHGYWQLQSGVAKQWCICCIYVQGYYQFRSAWEIFEDMRNSLVTFCYGENFLHNKTQWMNFVWRIFVTEEKWYKNTKTLLTAPPTQTVKCKCFEIVNFPFSHRNIFHLIVVCIGGSVGIYTICLR